MKSIEVVAAVIVKDNKVFCCKRGPGRDLEGYYEFPGGKIEINGLYLRDAKADMWGHVYAGYDSGELSLAEYYIMQAELQYSKSHR